MSEKMVFWISDMISSAKFNELLAACMKFEKAHVKGVQILFLQNGFLKRHKMLEQRNFEQHFLL